MESGKSTYSLFQSSLHGCGVQAVCEIQAGDTVLLEAPLHFLQTLPNRRSVIVCTACLMPLGSLATQLGVLQGSVSRENIIEECGSGNFPALADEDDFAEMIPCITGCGEMYCSDKCREHHWSHKGHKLLCTGLIPERGRGASPHAVQTARHDHKRDLPHGRGRLRIPCPAHGHTGGHRVDPHDGVRGSLQASVWLLSGTMVGCCYHPTGPEAIHIQENVEASCARFVRAFEPSGGFGEEGVCELSHRGVHGEVSTYLHISISPYLHISISPYLYISVSPYLHIYISPYLHISIYPYLHLLIYLPIYTYTHLHIYTSNYLYLHILISSYPHILISSGRSGCLSRITSGCR
jgi:hypothetical protein